MACCSFELIGKFKYDEGIGEAAPATYCNALYFLGNFLINRTRDTYEFEGLLERSKQSKYPTTTNNNMHSPSPPPTTTSTYTTIPISGTDVISRSYQNLSTFISRHRPWPEFIATTTSFDRPDSLSTATTRLRLNTKYFWVNYTILLSICAALSLIGSPITLIIFSLIFAMWMILYFFREDPMVMWGHHVSDRFVIVGLVLVSALAVWLMGFINNLLIGVAVGVFILAVHGVLRNPDGLFLDENDAASDGLIGSRLGPSSHRLDLSN